MSFYASLASQKVGLWQDFSLEKWFVFIGKLKLFDLHFIFVDFLKPYSAEFFGEDNSSNNNYYIIQR